MMRLQRRRRTAFQWLCGLRARYLLALALGAYLSLSAGLPYLLLATPALASIARLSKAAAPLLALVLLVPLPAALWRAWRERRLVRRLRSLDQLRAMNWSDLEILTRRLFEQQGYHATRLGGEGADGGVDIVLRRQGMRILVQCKQWKTRQVGVGVVRELLGVVTLHRADGGIIVTCGVFTKEARDFARLSRLQLIDGLSLLDMARDTPSPRQETGCGGALEDNCSCPVCGGQMVRRLAKAGAFSGEAFLGCAKFPNCKGTRPL